MKIYIKDEGRTVCVRDESATDIYEVLNLFKGAIIALGFHPDTFKDGIIQMAEEYEIEEEQNCNDLAESHILEQEAIEDVNGNREQE